jgi:hypothetical protein
MKRRSLEKFGHALCVCVALVAVFRPAIGYAGQPEAEPAGTNRFALADILDSTRSDSASTFEDMADKYRGSRQPPPELRRARFAAIIQPDAIAPPIGLGSLPCGVVLRLHLLARTSV